MVKSKWQILLESALATEEYEIDCAECHELLDRYVELLLESADAAEIMPTVKQHLFQCNCCTDVLEAILIMLDEAVPRDETQ